MCTGEKKGGAKEINRKVGRDSLEERVARNVKRVPDRRFLFEEPSGGGGGGV